MKQILRLSAIMVVASCSQKIENAQVAASSSEETELQKRLVKEYSLPPEPDVEENNATINGVDVNNNLIRDDWERAIVFEFHEDKINMNLHNALAKNTTLLNNYYEDMNVDEYAKASKEDQYILECAGYFYGMNMFKNRELFKKGEDTRERIEYILKRDSEMSEYLGYGIHGTPSSKLESICQKYRLETVNAKNLSKKEIEEKFNLPPEPDPKVNNSTILGVDSNNNDIRDDWERAIAFEYYQDKTRMNLNNLFAKNSTQLTKAYNSGSSDKYKELDTLQSEIIDCAYYLYKVEGFGSAMLQKMGSNTYARKRAALKRDHEISEVIGYGIHGLTTSQLKEICQKYK